MSTTREPMVSTPPALVRSVGRFVFRFRDYLAPAGLAMILVLTHPEQLFGNEQADTFEDVFGVLLCLIGQAVRVTVIGYAYIVRGGANKQLHAPKLVCEGFYAHSRNPMYVGNFLLLGGLAVIYNSRWVYLIAMPLFIGGIMSIIRAEEGFLHEKFGAEYEDYCRRVNRFWPRLQGLRQTLAPMTFDWKRVLRKEYGTTFAWVSAAMFLETWEHLFKFGYRRDPLKFHLLAAAWVVLLLAYGTVRFLKKTHRLDS
ncbi:MAG TPA: isoprenylcysteine carboxylmethyltransferase family protein [Candidatus Kryptonia bacterium]|nr:isoprenylcysteine carboxylmethyltransferase family protein [Candidatus Kryptonia bacterium]